VFGVFNFLKTQKLSAEDAEYAEKTRNWQPRHPIIF